MRILLLSLLLTPVSSATAAEPVRVGILVYEGVFNTEFVAPYDIFDHADSTDHPVQVFLVAPDAKPVVTYEGMTVSVDHTFAQHPPIDILVIPSFADYEKDLGQRKDVIDWVDRTSRKARYVLSNCWGAFFLAQAGLLDGRWAMTYPPDIEKLQQRFPKLKAIYGKRFVRDGKYVTGGGGVASYENALYVVQELWGVDLARRIASGLVMDWNLDQVAHLIRPRQTH